MKQLPLDLAPASRRDPRDRPPSESGWKLHAVVYGEAAGTARMIADAAARGVEVAAVAVPEFGCVQLWRRA